VQSSDVRPDGSHDAGVPSEQQTEWVDVAERVRDSVKAKLAAVPAMTVDELKEFVDLCHEAQRLEIDSNDYDGVLRIRRARANRYEGDPEFNG
jgi:hypothetical protein